MLIVVLEEHVVGHASSEVGGAPLDARALIHRLAIAHERLLALSSAV